MVEKTLHFYSDTANQSPFNNDRLVVEISASYIAIWIKITDRQQIGAFELFHFDSEKMAWYDIFFDIRNLSKLLERGYTDTRVFYNFPQAVIVPAEKFDNESAREYLALMHGEIMTDVVKFDNIKSSSPVVNVYRISKDLSDMVSGNLMMVNERHSFSVLVEDILRPDSPFKYTLHVKVQFHYDSISVAVANNGKLLLVQSYDQNGSEDILYHLLNILQQLNFKPDDAVLELSGLFDLKCQLYDDICNVFAKIKLDNITEEQKFHDMLEDYPKHYLTPFLKLIS
ncbi:DUF3822 family protein [Chitinophagaceae bacterium LWZ2-11]